jgi:hypothetical protein
LTRRWLGCENSLRSESAQRRDHAGLRKGDPGGGPAQSSELASSTEQDEQSQLARHAAESRAMLARHQPAVIANANACEVLTDAVRLCPLSRNPTHRHV